MTEELVPTALDRHFAVFMIKLHGGPHPELFTAAQSVSAWRSAGHSCVPAGDLGDEAWLGRLRTAEVIGAPGDFKPLILDAKNRLYLQRYWAYEAQLAAAIQARLATPVVCDEALLQTGLERSFGAEAASSGQALAAATAVRKNFCVITGGPGSGKTHTVAIVLALMAEQFAAQGRPPRIALAAPTGKAAARMKESISRVFARNPQLAPHQSVLATEATTIHRLLGWLPNSPYFRHDQERPLPVDVLVVDEASMVDLALMAKLFAATPAHARVLLLGDKDQLASVEAGNVLGDICGPPHAAARSTPLAAQIVPLTRNFRFTEESGIHQLSLYINAGDAEGALTLLRSGAHADLHFRGLPAAEALESLLRPRVLEGYRTAMQTSDPAAALENLAHFRILCAIRGGPFGVENLNRLAVRVLTEAGLITGEGAHFAGRPILILKNDYPLHLFNGDVGLILPDAEAGGELRAFFLDAGGALRRLLPARLPEHETTFAMTVHKSQGSEFQRILMILPERESAVATRELLYTGLTRARTAVEVWAPEAGLRAAIRNRTRRSSGLGDTLWPE